MFVSGCYQSSASLVGPAYTLSSTGNIYHAGLTYGLNTTLEKKTCIPRQIPRIGFPDEKKFFSHRRNMKTNNQSTGRMISAISII